VIAILWCIQLVLPFIWIQWRPLMTSSIDCTKKKESIVQPIQIPKCAKKGPRVAVCFYGLNRSLRYTIQSIRNHILFPLINACADVELYFHTWTLIALNDTHNGEAGVPLGGPSEELDLLNRLGILLKRYIIEDQTIFDKTLEFNRSAYAAIDERYNGPNLRNLLRQLESLRRVTQLWELDRKNIDFILYLRPDLSFLDDLNITTLFNLGATQFMTPYWGQYTGLNDRLVAGRPRTAIRFGNRLDLTWYYASNIQYLRSEAFLKWVMINHHRLRPVITNLRAQCIRATGLIAPNDICLRYCQYPKHIQICRADCRRILPPDVPTPPRPAWAIEQQKRDLESGKITIEQVRERERRIYLLE